MNGTEQNTPTHKPYSPYHPFDEALHSALIDDGFKVSYLNGKANVSYGARLFTFSKKDYR